ncbi:enkurin [Diorhabda carinulata]|uniref:enkurin n=1 Tax=Diorhabda carinulata TaxID=1163345 RepID=UPI0025A30D8A|nr:enkurin [Diorhabda carinulata]
MGVPETKPPDPHNFLGKHTGRPCYSVKIIEKEPTPTCRRKIDVPKRSECSKNLKLSRPRTNFVIENVETVGKMKPKEPIPIVVTDRYGINKWIFQKSSASLDGKYSYVIIGTRKTLKSGLVPVYIKIKTFGKVPSYLKKIIDLKEKKCHVNSTTNGVEQILYTNITSDQREALLEGLKQNWKELQQQYQRLPLLTDTIPKLQRKSKIEADLKQLEEDIVFLEKHPHIYVYEDNKI